MKLSRTQLRGGEADVREAHGRSALQSAYLHAVLTAVLLALFALWNGGAILYPDTHEYLARPANLFEKAAPAIFENDFSRDFDAVSAGADAPPADATQDADGADDGPARLMAGRSPYWGAVAFLFYSVAGFAGIIAAGALMLGIALALGWSRGLGLGFGWQYYAVIAVLSTVTAAGVFVALMTPDVLTPVLIISTALLLARWERLGWLDRVVLGALSCLATVSHDSHIAVLLAMVLLGLVSGIVIRRRVMGTRLAVAALPLVVGISGLMLLGYVARVQTGHPPARLPFIVAHLSDIPESGTFLAEACPKARYELCRHLPQFERGSWIDFLFSPAAQGGVVMPSTQPERDRLVDEQMRVLLAALAAKPVGVGGALVGDAVRQIFVIDLSEVATAANLPKLRTIFRDDVMARTEQTSTARQPGQFVAFDRLQAAVGFGAMALLLVLAWRQRHLLIQAKPGMGEFVLLVVAGVLANALICGILAAPLGRFQARVSFLLVFLALGLLAAGRAGRGTRGPADAT